MKNLLRSRVLAFATIPLVIGIVVIGEFIRALDDQGKVAAGVTLGETQVGGFNAVQLQDVVNSVALKIEHQPIVLLDVTNKLHHRSWTTDAQHLGLGIDITGTVNKVMLAGQNGTLGTMVSQISAPKPIVVEPVPTLDEARLAHELRLVSKTLDVPAVNAKVLILKSGGFGIKHGSNGSVINISEASTEIQSQWNSFINTAPSQAGSSPATNESSAVPSPIDVTLPFMVSQPTITDATLSSINGELSSYTSYYRVGLRGDNISVAASHINGMVLMPGETFSYNNVVGPRTPQDGFKPAPVIIDGQLKPGIGGGVCQVSSTLYNAALLAGMKIVERVHHGFPVEYLHPGRDATVAYGAIDFQFQNSSKYPILLRAIAKGGVMQFIIFGHKIPGEVVKLVRGYIKYGDIPTQIVKDHQLPKGDRVVEQTGHPDIKALWYRTVTLDGKVIEKEPILTHYEAFPTIIDLGTRGAGSSHTQAQQ